MQAYGAACLWAFCREHGLDVPSVAELVLHLASVLTEPNLPQWEANGGRLQLPGRGDPLPVELTRQAGPSAADFEKLLHSVVEIGLVDMYGDDTDQPLHFLNSSIAVLQRTQSPLPKLSEVIVHNPGTPSGWGDPVSRDDYRHAMQWFFNHGLPRP